MPEKVILLICREPDRAEPIARELERACDRRVETLAAHDDAAVPGGLDGCALIVFYLDRSEECDPLVEVLRVCTMSGRPVPVVALSDLYDEGQALTCFRLGVTDYLSLADHREVLPTVVGKLIAEQAQARAPWVKVQEGAVRGGKVPRSRAVLKG